MKSYHVNFYEYFSNIIQICSLDYACIVIVLHFLGQPYSPINIPMFAIVLPDNPIYLYLLHVEDPYTESEDRNLCMSWVYIVKAMYNGWAPQFTY